MSVRITLVTPSFNQAKYFEETLQSIAAQRDQLHEWFVIDGGSTDGSVDLIKKYADKIDYWVSEKDSGQSDAIQKGFSRATGDVLAWLNSDDVYLPGALATVRQAFDQHPNWDVLTGYHVQIDADSRVLSMHRIPRESPRAARWGIFHVAQQTCFFRRALFEKVGGLDLKLHCVMDGDLWCRMLGSNAVWGHVPRYLAAFRKHPTAKGLSWRKEYDQEMQILAQRYPGIAAPSSLHKIGSMAYRASQILSGRQLRARLDLRAAKGRTIDEVFGQPGLPDAPRNAVGMRRAVAPRS
jgi:glycosyltransferase involved in cell wall biosynthesis